MNIDKDKMVSIGITSLSELDLKDKQEWNKLWEEYEKYMKELDGSNINDVPSKENFYIYYSYKGEGAGLFKLVMGESEDTFNILINHCFVREKYRQQGLLKTAIETLKYYYKDKKPKLQFQSVVSNRNTNTIKSFEKLNFIKVEDAPCNIFNCSLLQVRYKIV